MRRNVETVVTEAERLNGDGIDSCDGTPERGTVLITEAERLNGDALIAETERLNGGRH